MPFKALTIAGLLSVSCSAAEASSLDAYAGVVGGAGNGSTSTFGPLAELSFFVLSYLPIPLGGISQTGYTGGISQVSAASGPLTNSMSVGPVILGNPTFGAFFDGTANSVANYGSLGASAHANILGGLPGNPLALFSSAGAAKFSDTFTVSSPLVASTSAGFVRYQFSVDGSLTSLGTPAPFFFGGTLATLVIQQQGGPVYEILVAQVYRGETGTILGSPPPPGWTTSMGSLSGGSTFYSLDLPMNWGQPWDVSVGLLAQAYGTADTNFLTTAKLTGLELFDANHVQVTQFSINSVSGTDYINAGPTPEPATMLLLGTGLAALAGARKLKKQLPA